MSVATPDEGFEQIEVACEGRGGEHIERFIGRWLVAPDEKETRAAESDFDTVPWDYGYYWGVALTSRGQFAVYAAHCNSGHGHLEVFPHSEDLLAADNIPPSIVGAAMEELTGDLQVIDRDI